MVGSEGHLQLKFDFRLNLFCIKIVLPSASSLDYSF
jgi:hypothetical protein